MLLVVYAGERFAKRCEQQVEKLAGQKKMETESRKHRVYAAYGKLRVVRYVYEKKGRKWE